MAYAQSDASDAPACPVMDASPTSAPPPIPSRVDGPSGVVALTFDAGADRGYAEDILDTLADAHIPATFGMTGQWASAYPELVQRMAADGHMLINHTRTTARSPGCRIVLAGCPPRGGSRNCSMPTQ